MKVETSSFIYPLTPFHELKSGEVFATIVDNRIEEFYIAVRRFGHTFVEYGARLEDGIMFTFTSTAQVYVVDAKAVMNTGKKS